jgi:hypothetical protein
MLLLAMNNNLWNLKSIISNSDKSTLTKLYQLFHWILQEIAAINKLMLPYNNKSKPANF